MSNLRYRKLKQEGEEDEVDGSDFDNSQFEKPKTKVPWKAISYAVILLLIGTILLTIGCLIVTGHIDQEKHNERFWPMILLGALMFIPGSYHTYFAYKAFIGDPNWSFEEFPDF